MSSQVIPYAKNICLFLPQLPERHLHQLRVPARWAVMTSMATSHSSKTLQVRLRPLKNGQTRGLATTPINRLYAVLVLVEVKNLFPWRNNQKYMNTSVLRVFQKSVNHPIKKRNLSHRDGLLGS